MRLQSIVTPLTEFDHPEKGDALYGELPCISFLFAESDLWIRMGSECQVPQRSLHVCGTAEEVTKAHCCQKVEFVLQLNLVVWVAAFQYMDGWMDDRLKD